MSQIGHSRTTVTASGYRAVSNALTAGLWSLYALLVAGLSLIGPIATSLVLVATLITGVALFTNLGFVTFTGLISHVNDIEGFDFGLLRAIKWIMLALFAVVVLVKARLTQQTIWSEFSYVEKYFLLFFLWGVICSLTAVNPVESFSTLFRISALAVVFVLTRATIRDRGDLRVVFLIFGLAVVSSGLYSLSQVLFGHYFRVRGFLDNANGYGMFLIVTVPILLVAALTTRQRFERLFYAVAVSIGTVCVALTWARSAWLSLFVTLLIFSLLQRRRIAMLGVVVAPTLLALIVLLSPSLQDRISAVLRLQAGTTHRTALWKAGVASFIQSPVVGNGLELTIGDVMQNVRESASEIAFRIPSKQDRYHTHNLYLYYLSALGLPGFLLLVCFLQAHFRFLGKQRTAAVDATSATLWSMMIAVSVGACISMFFEGGPIFGAGSYSNYFWIILGALCAVSSSRDDATRNITPSQL